jgi:hypothetical protein
VLYDRSMIFIWVSLRFYVLYEHGT